MFKNSTSSPTAASFKNIGSKWVNYKARRENLVIDKSNFGVLNHWDIRVTLFNFLCDTITPF